MSQGASEGSSEGTYYEDLVVGAVRRFGRYAVDRDEVLAFARAYDPQPFHLSDEAAAATHFGRLAASGWHTCAMCMAMIVADGEAQGLRALGSPGLEELRWLKPVYPGDVLRCESELLAKRVSASRPGVGIATMRLAVFNQDDVAVMRMTNALLVARRTP